MLREFAVPEATRIWHLIREGPLTASPPVLKAGLRIVFLFASGYALSMATQSGQKSATEWCAARRLRAEFFGTERRLAGCAAPRQRCRIIWMQLGLETLPRSEPPWISPQSVRPTPKLSLPVARGRGSSRFPIAGALRCGGRPHERRAPVRGLPQRRVRDPASLRIERHGSTAGACRRPAEGKYCRYVYGGTRQSSFHEVTWLTTLIRVRNLKATGFRTMSGVSSAGTLHGEAAATTDRRGGVPAVP